MDSDAWPSHSANMFSSVLPGLPTNMQFVHNPPSKPSNRYVKSSTNPNVSYLSNPSLYDLGYLSILPVEGPPATWYPNSSYNLPYGQNYAIYSTSASNNLNYDQSTQFLDFHDTSSIADFPVSPAMSNDDCQSTISELEVEERDRIAKINAEYNAISHAGSLNDSPSPPNYSPDRVRESNPTLQLSSLQTRPYLPVSVSQPRHPDLHFPQRQIGSEKKESSSPPYRIYASPVVSIPQDLSPPSVERLPSQLPLEQNVITSRTPPQSRSSPPVSSRNYNGSSELDRPSIIQNGISSSTGFIQSSPQTGHPTSVGQSYISGVERSQTLEPTSIVPAEITRKPKSSVVIANGHSPPTLPSDIQENLQNKQRSPPAAPMLIQAPSTTTNNHSPPYSNNSPDSRQYTDIITSLSHAQINKATESECPERISLGTTLRRDTKTPSGRGLSNTQPDFEWSLTSSPDAHNSPDMRDKAAHKSSPKRFFAGNLDNGRSPADSLSSSDSSCSSISPSHRPLSHEDVLKLKTKDADYDKEFERHRRQRSTGTERTAPVPKFTDETSRGTVPLHTQGPLHLSPEGALATFLQPDPQVVSIVTSPEHRPTDLRHSKTVHETPILLDSRDSRKDHDRQYVNFAKPPSEITKHERNGMRMLSADLRSSPVNQFSTTSSSLPSKVTLDFPPTPTEPHRRRSDGDQVGPPIRPLLTGRNSAPMVRSVRWTENLVAPSPILAPPRRKGWYNRRGEQLWTNNGDYRPPRSGEDYPLDLDDYPEPGEGWMNEDGVRIDMSHCRIPKALPRPVLKKP